MNQEPSKKILNNIEVLGLMVARLKTPRLFVVFTLLAALLLVRPFACKELTPATEIESFLHKIAGDDLKDYFGFTPHIEIIQNASENAFAVGPNRIILTSALLKRLENYPDLCFVIAHEISHLILGHSTQFSSTLLPQEIYSLRLENELKADKKALELMLSAGVKTDQIGHFLHSLAGHDAERQSALRARIAAISR